MRRLALLTVLALVLGAASAAPKPEPKVSPPAPPPRSISGKVSGPDGKPVAGATVRVVASSPARGGGRVARRIRHPEVPDVAVAKTGADGTFTVPPPAGDTFAVRVAAKGAAPIVADDVPKGASLTLKLKPGVPVSGLVLDRSTGKPIAGAVVRALEHGAEQFGLEAGRETTTDDAGGFTLADCAPGAVALEAVAAGHARAHRDDVVARKPDPDHPAKPSATTLYLGPGGRLAGRVVDADGKPVVDATVWTQVRDGALFAALRETPPSRKTDPAGRFAFDGLAAGHRVTIHAAKEGSADGESEPVAVERGTDRDDLRIVVAAGATLKFKLLAADDTPVTEADVALRPHVERGAAGGRRRGFGGMGSGSVDDDRVTFAPDGTVTVKNVVPDRYDVTVSPTDFADVTREGVRLAAGATADIGTLHVRPAKSISGTVSDAAGRPVAGAEIRAFWFDGATPHSRRTRAKADGTYKISGLGDDPVRNLWVSAEGFATGRRDGAEPGDTAADFTLERLGTITGRVVMPDGSTPPAFEVQAHPEARERSERPGFRVMIGPGSGNPPKTFSDPSGSFRLDGVDPGTVTIEVRAEGAAPGKKTGLVVHSDQVTDAGTITLATGRTLRGRVLATKNDAPIPGATVTLSRPQGFLMRAGGDAADGLAVSAPDGSFEIDGLEARAYAVAASHPDYAPASGRVEIPSDQDVDDFVVHLSMGGILTGLVRDAQKQTIPGVQVMIAQIPMSGSGPQTATTSPDGRYTFEKLPPGSYAVMRAPTPGQPLMLSSGMKQATVVEGETTEFDLDEASAINLTGRVLRGDQPLPHATVMFNAAGGTGAPLEMKMAATDADGRYQVGLDKPGAYSVSVMSGGFRGGGGRPVTIQVPDEPNPVVDIPLLATGIAGRVSGTDGKPVSGAIVTAVAGDAGAAGTGHAGGRASSDPDGNYRIDGLDPGTYKVSVAAPGYRNAENPGVTVGGDGETPGIDFTLDSALSIHGHVVDAGGNGIAGAMVLVAATGSVTSGRASLPTTTDVNGAFVVTAPVDGPVDLTAVASGYPAARATGVNPSDDADVTLQAPRGGRIRIGVAGAGGAPVAGATVGCRPVPDFLGGGYQTFLNRPTGTGPDGVCVVGPLAPGSYECTVSFQKTSIAKTVDVGDGSEAALSVVLP